jgi:predicted LPLAT superfamily acyltransferase
MTAASFRPCAVIPSYNHWQALPTVIDRLRALGLPIFVVDDGSDAPARAELAALHAPERGVRVEHRNSNGGKGAAVITGFGLARAADFTHCIQIDADGQHDMAVVPDMLKSAQQRPAAIIVGQAIYDDSAPLGRVVGRWLTHVWVWIETLSFDIRDAMCGLRVYPIETIAPLLDNEMNVGKRMDFDIEVLVRLHRKGIQIVSHPTRVTYPVGNLSNFKLWRDNWHITKMHTRLVVGGLWDWISRRAASVLARDTAVSTHWSALGERGLYWGLQASALTYRLLGRRGCMAILSLVVFYFYITAGERRRASLAFLNRAFAHSERPRQVTWFDGYRHFLSFARRVLDSFIAWAGDMPRGSVVMAETAPLDKVAAQVRGAVFIVSHHGNVDISRALLDVDTRRRVAVLLHTRHAEHYNRILREFNPEAAVNTFQVTEFGPDTAIALQERIERGEWLFIAGDRTPVGGGNRVSAAKFLGAEAEFSQGPYLIAALLDCPVHLFFCQREGDRHVLRVEEFAERIVLPRGQRAQSLAAYVATYAARLEEHVLSDPFQWFNFYDFWRQSSSAARP